MRYHQCLILTLIFGCVIIQDVSGVTRVQRSVDENMHDSGIYVVHFKDTTTNLQLHHFAKHLIRRSNEKRNFDAIMIAEYPNIKRLTARLSKRALKWVRIMCHYTICYVNITSRYQN